MLNDISSIILSEDDLKKRIAELGEQITDYYKFETDIVAVGILKGSVLFMADIIRQIKLPVEIEFMAVSSYGKSTKTSGIVRILKDLDTDITGKNVLIIEDIIDSGVTLTYLKEYLSNRNPKSLKICTLLNKPARRKSNINGDFVGFDVEDEFLVGYGLDFAGKYRNLPFVGILKREIYQ